MITITERAATCAGAPRVHVWTVAYMASHKSRPLLAVQLTDTVQGHDRDEAIRAFRQGAGLDGWTLKTFVFAVKGRAL